LEEAVDLSSDRLLMNECRESLKKIIYLEDPGVYGKIIFKRILFKK
jgi:hypothetical protein